MMNAFQFGQMVKAALGPAYAGMAENVSPGYLNVEPGLAGAVANEKLKNVVDHTPAGLDRINFRGKNLNGIGGQNNTDIQTNDYIGGGQAFRTRDGYESAMDTGNRAFGRTPLLQHGDSRSFAPGAPRGVGSAARPAAPQLPKPAAPAPSAPANQSIFSALPKR